MYHFKSDNVLLDGTHVKIIPKELPSSPQDGELCIDIADKKLKVWNAPANMWFVLGKAADVIFDNTGTGLVSTNVHDAILEVKTQNQHSYHLIVLNRNGAALNTWLALGDSNVPSNDSPWTPPFDCKILKVMVTNRKEGRSDNPLLTKVEAFYKDFGESGSITTNDNSGFYVYSDGENIIQNGGYGRMWIYDNSSEGDYLYMNKQYGFRFKKEGGFGTPNDVIVTLLVEEI